MVKENSEKVKDNGTKKIGLSLTHILSLLDRGYSQTQIAKHLHCSKANITYHLKKAKEKGIIQREPYSIGNISLTIDKNKVKDINTGDVKGLEIHHLDFKFNIIKDNPNFLLSEQINLKNGTSYQLKTLSNGIVIRKYQNGTIIIQGIRVDSDNYSNAIAKATILVNDIKTYLEKAFRIRLTRHPEITKLPDIVPELPKAMREGVIEIAKQVKVESKDGFTIDESEGEGKGHAEYKLSKLKTKSQQEKAIQNAEMLSNLPQTMTDMKYKTDILTEQLVCFSVNLKQHLEVLGKIGTEVSKVAETNRMILERLEK
jgi:DNA-binding Lrp family transcriptional regulator